MLGRFGSTWGTANTKIAIHKNTNSSSDGTNSVANGAAGLAFLQVSDLTAATDCAINPTAVPATSTIPAYNLYTCGTAAGNAGVGSLTHTVRFGFSDSEPKQFNASVVSQLTSSYPVTIVMGIPVTKNVRDALQASQSLGNDETEANMPSLSTAQVNSILTGSFTAWSDLGITLPGGGDQTIYVGRRGAGSGTTRAIDETFVGTNCVPGASPLLGGTGLANIATSAIPAQCTGTGAGGSTLNQLGTSDDMASCLSSYQTNGVGAVGYLSTDYTPALADGYRWIKVDGYSPKQLNVANGTWKAWSEESLNYNKATALTGDDAKFYAAIKATSANGTLLSELGPEPAPDDQWRLGGWRDGRTAGPWQQRFLRPGRGCLVERCPHRRFRSGLPGQSGDAQRFRHLQPVRHPPTGVGLPRPVSQQA